MTTKVITAKDKHLAKITKIFNEDKKMRRTLVAIIDCVIVMEKTGQLGQFLDYMIEAYDKLLEEDKEYIDADSNITIKEVFAESLFKVNKHRIKHNYPDDVAKQNLRNYVQTRIETINNSKTTEIMGMTLLDLMKNDYPPEELYKAILSLLAPEEKEDFLKKGGFVGGPCQFRIKDGKFQYRFVQI